MLMCSEENSKHLQLRTLYKILIKLNLKYNSKCLTKQKKQKEVKKNKSLNLHIEKE